MSDQSLEPTRPASRAQQVYSDEDRYLGLAALDLNGGNLSRTAKATGIPARTLADWRTARERRRAEGRESPRAKEIRGDLAAKVESLAHSIVEAMPSKIDKATLSQCAVALGISVDKVRILRSIGLDPDPQAELCRLLGINRAQLPLDLSLQPGESIPDGFQDVIEMQPTPDHSGYEPVPALAPAYHHPDLGTLQTDPDQSSLPPGYIRLFRPADSQTFTIRAPELRPLHPDVRPSDLDLDPLWFNSIPDDDDPN